MKYIKLFDLDADYQSFVRGDDYIEPHVSYAKDSGIVYFNLDYSTQYLTFKTIEDSTFKLTQNNCQYSLDNGGTWTSLSAGTNTPTVSAGNKIMFKATNPSISSSSGIGIFSSTGKFNVEGNIMSLLYEDDFVEQNDLTGKDYVFYGLFSGCTNIIEAHNLILPATTLANYCYQYMFRYCTSLTTAPELPATTLADSCYQSMFQGCTSLITAPALPATTLASNCYAYMFQGCSSLISTPELPATTLANSCYYGMFNGCSSLTSTPELPATTLAIDCYQYMFRYCTSLTSAPELPTTTLTSGCYESMFRDCTSLTSAPELPATTLASSCYNSMFYGCSSLVTTPELPATTLANSCYSYMFYGCTSLNNIVMLATDISANYCLFNWVYGVASTGTFIKHRNITSLPTGVNGIPSGWEVKNYSITPTECTNLTITADDVKCSQITTTIHYTAICNGVDYKGETVTGFIVEGTAVSAEFPQNTSETETVERTITFEFMGVTASTIITQGVFINFENQYLTFEAIEDSTFKLTQNACEYSLDNGGTWTSLSAGTNTPTVSAGNKIMFKTTNPTISTSSPYGIGTFSSTGKFNVSGNIMSMLYGDDFIGQNDLTGKDYAFCYLFDLCTNVVEAHNLILPATTLANHCYSNMFYNCHSLTTAPSILPATTLADSCYNSMFGHCRKLTTAPELPATTLANYCYGYMFDNCWALTTAPELPATTLVDSCYRGMFNVCISLKYIKMLATNISAKDCLYIWVDDVESTGTFVKSAGVNIPSGRNGIPSGWTVQEV